MKTKRNIKIALSYVLIALLFTLIIVVPSAFAANISSVILNVGEDESVRALVYQSDTQTSNEVKLNFSNDEKDFTGAKSFKSTPKKLSNGKWRNTVTFNDLQPGKEYMYQIKGDTKVYKFRVSEDKDFSFVAFGDVQLGVGNLQKEEKNWDKTLKTVETEFHNIDFLLSLGDQVNSITSKNQDSEYDAFSKPEGLKKYPIAALPGNHDGSTSKTKERFYYPNETSHGGTLAGNDYFFRYKNALFIILNSNNQNTLSHKKAIKEAIAKYPDVKHRIVCFHHSIYSVANHSESPDILKRRKELVPVFDENKIDLVLMGHDHVYVRTEQLKNNIPVNKDNYYTDEGTVYTTLDSSSSSKFYGIKSKDFPYAKVKWQGKESSYTIVNVSDSEIKVSTYTTENKTLIDSYSIKDRINNNNQNNPTENNNENSTENNNNQDNKSENNNENSTENKPVSNNDKIKPNEKIISKDKSKMNSIRSDKKSDKESPKTGIASESIIALSLAFSAVSAIAAVKQKKNK